RGSSAPKPEGPSARRRRSERRRRASRSTAAPAGSSEASEAAAVSDAPLRGVTGLVTGSLEQAKAVQGPLAALGAEVILSPTIRFEEPRDWGPADAALRTAGACDRAIFTSANGVAAVGGRLAKLGLDWSVLRGVPLVAV